MIKTTVHKKGSSKANGTSVSGYINTSYYELVEMFGESLGPSSDNKVDAEWHVTLHPDADTDGDGAFVTIYNYKSGKKYCGESGLDVQNITEWHVGSKTTDRYSAVDCYDLLNAFIEQFSAQTYWVGE